MLASEFVQQVNTLSEQNVQLCYHCHKCTSGCPVAAEMRYGPDHVLRMVQLGQKDRLLACADIWVCASCETCGTRCPNEIDIARIMDSLRQMAYQEHAQVGEPDALKFHKLFLGLTRLFGRMHEASLMGILTLQTMKLASDVKTIFSLLFKGKAPLLPKPVKDRQTIQQIYQRTKHSGDSVIPKKERPQ
jgi:heterodisulfide reductase subunit C2